MSGSDNIVENKRKGIKHSMIIHGVLLLLLCIFAIFDSCSIKLKDAEPIEFLVDVSEMDVVSEEEIIEKKDDSPEKVEEEQEIKPEDIVIADKEKKVEKPKPPEKKKKEIKISDKIVTVKGKAPEIVEKPKKSNKKNDLTKEEIQRLLDLGATPSDRTVDPGEEGRCFALINKQLKAAWRKPHLAEASIREAELTLFLAKGGVVTSYKLTKSSGNDLLDKSAIDAGKAVKRIPGLTNDFIKSHSSVSIGFRIND